MKFKFDPNMDYQLHAVKAVVDLFHGQGKNRGGWITTDSSLLTVKNSLELPEEYILDNLQKVQEDNKLPQDDELVKGQFSSPNFTVEMETGTGKTYVYIRTALELFQTYGWRKFIIIVHSRAVKEGVLKTLEVTKEHFDNLYSNIPYEWFVYDSSKLNEVRNFGQSNNVSFMVITMQAFNAEKDAARIFNRYGDDLSEKPIDIVSSTRPIIILDEPQKMSGDKTIDRLKSFNPLFMLRYSATHKDYYNLLYRLSPYDAYRKGLVKQIEVFGITTKDATGKPLIVVESVKNLKAKLRVNKLMKTGVEERTITIKRTGDNLQRLTNLDQYQGYVVDEINVSENFISFENGIKIGIGSGIGDNKEIIYREQIRETIKEHFKKQDNLKAKGIKVISLFFIDRVANFIEETGLIRKLFIEAFNEFKKGEWENYSPEDVWAYYFTQKSKKEYVDTGGASKADEQSYNLIMKDKERLLSFEEPSCFIFSHSALREGWDNPNVFQICTLKQTKSSNKVSKRQEIGRGVRLAVNQIGERTFDEEINKLTVVTNESYKAYISTLQTEIENEGGDSSKVEKYTKDRGKTVSSKLKKISPEFKALWDKIKYQTRYSVDIDSKRLLNQVVKDLKAIDITKSSIVVQKANVKVEKDANRIYGDATVEKKLASVNQEEPLTDLLTDILHHLRQCNPPLHLSRNTLWNLVNQTAKTHQLLTNSTQFVLAVTQSIKVRLIEEIIEGIKYENINSYYEMRKVFDAEQNSWEDTTVEVKNSVYDRIIWESDIEHQFARDLDKNERVIKFFVKLPRKFKVTTPVGDYNPDWAIAIDDSENPATECSRLYLVAETKGSTSLENLRPQERHKIECGEKHFETLDDVKFVAPITTVEELLTHPVLKDFHE